MKGKYINKYTIIIGISLIIFLLVVKDILMYDTISYDTWAFNTFSKNLRSNEMTLFMSIITDFGSLLFILSLFVVLLLLYKNKKTLYYLLINTISILLINDFLKHLIHRSRPNKLNIINTKGFSFPSSHAMISVVFYGLLVYLVFKNIKNKVLKYILIVLLTIIVLSICISRIYLGAHYLSDIVGGISLGIICLMIFLMTNNEFEKRG